MFKYFQKLPLTFYTLDNYQTTQVIPNYFIRTKFLPNVVNNVALFDEYQIKDGETPEITSMEFYGDTGLYWIILQANDITDPRFGWPLDQHDLKRFTEGKYNNINAPHHYEDNGGNVVSATIVLTANTSDPDKNFQGVSNNTVVTNNTNTGIGLVTNVISNQSVVVVTNPGNGGFISGDQLLSSNSLANPEITSIDILSGTPITNLIFEDRENEEKRKIKIIKKEIVSEIISEFETIVKS